MLFKSGCNMGAEGEDVDWRGGCCGGEGRGREEG